MWLNPVCGDGLCEEPWEFPQYAEFGCRADCGDLPSRFNLTTLQLDLEWDFSHVAGTDELRARAQWNLCPASGDDEKPPHGSACYYERDQKFESVSGDCFGSQCPEPLLLYDVPAGTAERPTRWEIRLKGDIFQKVSGSVLSFDNVTAEADAIKVDIAIEAARNVTDSEATILRNASSFALLSVEDAVTAYKGAQRDAVVGDLDESIMAAEAAKVLEEAKLTDANATIVAEYVAEVTRLTALKDEANANYTAQLNALLACPGGLQNIADSSGATQAAKRRQEVDPCQTELVDIFTAREADVKEMVENRNTNSRALGKSRMDSLVLAVRDDNAVIYKSITRATGLLATDTATASMDTLFNDYVTRTYAAAPDGGNAARLVPALLQNMELEAIAETAGSRAAELEQRATFAVTIPERQIDYVSFKGSTDEYMRCNIAKRAPEYLGTCLPPSEVAKIDIPKKEDAVQMEVFTKTCDAICDCKAPKLLDDGEFGPARAECGAEDTCVCQQCLPDGATMPSGLRRRLLQDSASLSALDDSLTRLSGKQGDLDGAVQTLKTELGKSFAARAKSQSDLTTSLKDSMTRGFDDLKVGQSDITKKLDQIIGQQERALAAAERAASLAEQNNNMIKRRGEQFALVQKAVEQQLLQIEDAARAGVISGEQRKDLLVNAEVNRAVQLKKSALSNSPCTEQPARHAFQLATKDGITYPTQINSTRFRMVGLTNRVVAGMMLHSTRKSSKDCGDKRFDKITEECRGAYEKTPYGIDPVFRASSTLYDPDLDNQESVTGLYNCTELLGTPTTYCPEYFNSNNVPYGFFHRRVPGYPDGYFVWYDINLNAENAQRYFLTMQEGLFLDSRTDEVRAQIVTYNAELQVFGNVEIFFQSSKSGQFNVLHSTKVVDVELYVTDLDNFRMFLEIVLGIALIFAVYNEAMDLVRAKKKYGKYTAYFESLWNYIDVINLSLMMMGYITWWTYAFLAEDFRCKINYNIYADLEAEARIYKIAGNGEDLDSLANMYGAVSELTERLAFYYAIAGVNIMLYLLRVLKLMHFQPRLGVVTRTLTLAAADLFHFFVLFFVIFFGYAIMGYLVFGNTVETFSTIPDSIMTCFEFLLGEIGVNAELKKLDNWQFFSGQVFFWTYALLVQQILLNFVLAIIVDAYSEVKQQSHETVGILTEIAEIFSDTWKKNLKRIGLYKTYVPNHRVRLLLEAWVKGMSLEELEEEHRKEEDAVFVEKPKVIKVGEQELDKNELAAMVYDTLGDGMMKQVMKDVPGEDVAMMVADTIVDSYGSVDDDEEDDEEENNESKAAELEALAKQVLEEQQQLANLQDSILKQQHSILLAFGSDESGAKSPRKA